MNIKGFDETVNLNDTWQFTLGSDMSEMSATFTVTITLVIFLLYTSIELLRLIRPFNESIV